MKLAKLALGVLVVGIIFMLFAPIIFTQFGVVSFNERGQIGYTIWSYHSPYSTILEPFY